MSSGFLDEIRTSLAPRYRIERELGQGGMGTVYLAHDTTTDTPVALKMLRPELTSVVGRDRFVRESNIAATLDHPNLLRLLDKGETNGFLYYTMPYVDGPTLRQRLSSGGPMSIEECVELGAQLAEAIGHANEQGIVHRDIKPENVLLSGGRALLADFGIAQVLTLEQARKLTSTGITVGTPAYMSPEQVARDRIDGRSDQYSLACVLYEMLGGDPPFASRELRAVLARHALDPVPSLLTIRPAVPPALERAIMKALAKQPADRWPTAFAFAKALRESLTAPAEPAMPVPWRRPRVVVSAMTVVALLAFLAWRQLADAGPLDSHLLAVVPLHVEGSPAPPTSGEGMAEAMRARIEGIGDWRAMVASSGSGSGDALTVAQARRIARRLGAGTVLTGKVLSTPTGLSIDAALTDVANGRALATFDRLTMPADQLLDGLDRAALTLLVRATREPEHREPGLLQRKPDAVKEYLTGVTRFRQGRYKEAVASFQKAMRSDTTFAMAGLMAFWTGNMAGDRSAAGAGYRRVSPNTNQLSATDAQVFRAEAGPRAPWPSSYFERLRAWSRVADSLPHSREAALQSSRMLSEWGLATGNFQAPQQAANLLRGVLANDSSFAPAFEGLLDLGSFLVDTAEIRRIGAEYVARNPRADRQAYYRWRVAALLRAPDRATHARALIDSATTNELNTIILQAQLHGGALDDAMSAAEKLGSAARTSVESWDAMLIGRELAHNMGRVIDAPPWPSPLFTVPIQPLFQVVQSLYWDGDSLSAASMVAERTPMADGPPPPPDPGDNRYMDICTVGLWRARGEDWARVRAAVARLGRAGSVEKSASLTFIPVCRATLSAMVASATNDPTQAQELQQLDSIAASSPPTTAYIMLAANMTVARLKEARGDIPGALAAARRRSFARNFGGVGLSTYLREEGRLAALAGDVVGARNAYTKYLALRENPEPRLAADVQRAKAALDALNSPAQPGRR